MSGAAGVGAQLPSEGPRPTVRHLGVLVPVRDEEQLLGRCLTAVAAAVQALHARDALVAVDVVVVLDGCRDGSAGTAAAVPWPAASARPHLLETAPLGVGRARATGAAHLLHLARERGTGPAVSWLAGTDADSTVPEGWLLAQVDASRVGYDGRVGTVVLSARDQLAARWTGQQQHVEGHGHVHGANLGVRGDAYLRAGGYPPVTTGEDVALVEALQRTGARLLRTAQAPVVTSDRLSGRAPDGVAADLADLAASAVDAEAS
ncbi:glycosyltransferase [Jannaschia sp. R86511]|uniref:glycosyltransferase n=1 Tax=Jannaschia sp. R86511 TaxID=3093853 RepID=UPI0036D24CE5